MVDPNIEIMFDQTSAFEFIITSTQIYEAKEWNCDSNCIYEFDATSPDVSDQGPYFVLKVPLKMMLKESWEDCMYDSERLYLAIRQVLIMQ